MQGDRRLPLKPVLTVEQDGLNLLEKDRSVHPTVCYTVVDLLTKGSSQALETEYASLFYKQCLFLPDGS